MGNVFKVSQSKVKTYRRCHAAYHNKYVEQLRRKLIKRPFKFGRIVHECFEDTANGGEFQDTLDRLEQEEGKLFKQEIEEYGDILDDVRVILTDYFDYWGEKSIRYVRIKGKSSEFVFEVDIAPGIILTGKIDNIGKTPNDLRWLVEHKTGKNMPNEDHRWRNLQSSVYTKVIDMVGLKPVDGTMWDFIRSKPPSAPKILKSGDPSTRDIDSLPTKINEWLAEQGIVDKEAHASLITRAKNNRSHYFARDFSPTKPRVIERLWDDFIDTAVEMKKNHGKVREMNIDRHCEWCEYEALCRAELTGGDVRYLKKKDYYVSEKHDEEEPDFEA
jgi:hypothetical protein